jgi:hypothetical protein
MGDDIRDAETLRLVKAFWKVHDIDDRKMILAIVDAAASKDQATMDPPTEQAGSNLPA